MLKPQQKSKKIGYFQAIGQATRTLSAGLKVTLQHFRSALAKPKRGAEGPQEARYFDKTEGVFTLNFPHEQLPVPDNARYLLHNESEDCIVCNKCAEICPVDCIDIEPVRSTEQIGTAADGTPIRMYAATFDIDMGKCCYCGLCTTVCPTQCLTMTPTFDHSEFKLDGLVYGFENITPEEAERVKAEYEAAQEAKRKAAAAKKATKPVVKPKIKVKSTAPIEQKEQAEKEANSPKPKIKVKSTAPIEQKEQAEKEANSPKPKIKVKARPATKPKPEEEKLEEEPKTPRPKIKVKMREKPEETTESKSPQAEKPARPKIKVKMRPKTEPKEEAKEKTPEAKKPARPKIKLKMRPPRKPEDGEEEKK